MPTAVTSPRDRMISPMMMAWFRSPPGEDSKHGVACREMGLIEPSSETSLAAAAPMVPLRASACLPRPGPAISTSAISDEVRLGETYWSFQ